MIPQLTALVFATAPAPAWMNLPKQELDRAMAALEAKPFAQRFLAATERFRGTPYANSPLGEGKGRDSDPWRRRWR
jgi:hypothetical protein